MLHHHQVQATGLRADLHVHTCASDSRWTPGQVVAGCLGESIELLAVADHDSIGSVTTAEDQALANGIAFLRAVEVSTRERGLLLHILAYGVDPDSPPLRELLAENQRRAKAGQIANVRQLQELGYPVDAGELESYTYERTRGGFKTLNYLIDKGIVADIFEWARVIGPQLDQRYAGYVRPRRAIEAIRAAGGVPVLAHPGASLRPAGGTTEENLTWLVGEGIEGYECYSQYHDVATIETMVAFCAAHDLVITGGSDYHGGFTNRRLGHPEAYTSMLNLKEIADRIRYPEPVAEPAR